MNSKFFFVQVQPVTIHSEAPPEPASLLQQGGMAVAVILALTCFLAITLEKLIKIIKSLR